MMLLKLKDIHQQIQIEGEKWFETRSDLRTEFLSLFHSSGWPVSFSDECRDRL